MKPRLAITLGDPAGIGPEVALKALAKPELCRSFCPILFGAPDVAQAALEQFAPGLRLARLEAAELSHWRGGDDQLALVACPTGVITVGEPSAESGRQSFDAIKASIDSANAGLVSGVVTAPISKHALHLAGHSFPGHTEMFGEFSRSDFVAMMMYCDAMAIGLVTCHQSLASVSHSLTRERIVKTGTLLSDAVARLRGTPPAIAVLGLNPHAGEEGMFGREEIEVIAPAIDELRRLGINAEGPLPPDTAFVPRAQARYGAWLCMYHDQGLIPFKMLHMDIGINVTLGLPFVRTSPDHGTAFDIAGRGVAEESSMVEAIRLAVRLSH